MEALRLLKSHWGLGSKTHKSQEVPETYKIPKVCPFLCVYRQQRTVREKKLWAVELYTRHTESSSDVAVVSSQPMVGIIVSFTCCWFPLSCGEVIFVCSSPGNVTCLQDPFWLLAGVEDGLDSLWYGRICKCPKLQTWTTVWFIELMSKYCCNKT